MLASHKGEIPFVVLLVPFLAGISLALARPLATYQTLIVASFGVLLPAFVILNVLYSRAGFYRRPWLGGLFTNLILVLAGMLCFIKYDNRNRAEYFEKQPGNLLQVKVNSEPQLKNGLLRFTADAEARYNKGKSLAVSGQLMITLRAAGSHPAVNYGDVLLLPAKYQPVDPPFNPGEFNYKQYLAHQNIYGQAFLNPGDIHKTGINTGNRLIGWSLALRQRLVADFKKFIPGAEASAVASTLILGYKADLDNDVLQAYSKTGTIHVLSVSGAHVAIIFALLSWLLGFLDRYRHGKTVKAILIISLIWYYALLTGLSPAVCRAAVMISFFIAGKAANRRINSLNLLAASAFFLLLINPFLLADVGFQLSYMAVAGLIVFQPIIYSWLDIENAWLDKLWLACSVSIAAQAITFPLSAYYFHQFPVYFLVSNLFIIIPSFLIMYGGMTLLMTAQMGIGLLSRPIGWLVGKTILIMDKGLQLVERSPYALVDKIWLTKTEQLLLFVSVILFFCVFYYKQMRYLRFLLVCLLVISISFSFKKINSYRDSSMIFLNLKKSPAILFKQGDQAVLLTDLKDTAKVYRYSIQPGLDSSQIKHLSTVTFAKDTVTSYFAKYKGLVRFAGDNLLLINKDPSAIPGLAIRYCYLTDNPYNTMRYLPHLPGQPLFISASGNSNRFDNLLVNQAKMHSQKFYLLKRNKCFIVQSNL